MIMVVAVDCIRCLPRHRGVGGVGDCRGTLGNVGKCLGNVGKRQEGREVPGECQGMSGNVGGRRGTSGKVSERLCTTCVISVLGGTIDIDHMFAHHFNVSTYIHTSINPMNM